MNTAARRTILTINGGSSSIKFALFEMDGPLRRVLGGRIEGIGTAKGNFTVKGAAAAGDFSRPISAPDHTAAVKILMDWIQQTISQDTLAAVGHRVVHGGPKYWEPQRITPAMVRALEQLSPFDPEHLPEEILLTRAFHKRFLKLPQFACFDTAFHHDLPRAARMLPIPRRYEAKGVRRYGFHGLSCAFLMEELSRAAGAPAANGRVILAHLGNGASITAVRHGRSMDTSMAFTPTAGMPMSSRSGDLDPGLAWYLSRAEKVTASQFQHMINHESGLLGISETSSDLRVLLAHEKKDVRAAEAVAMFCYQARKWICGMTGALAGLDTLVFAGGIGENLAPVRARICENLDFLGLKIDPRRNTKNAAVISTAASRVTVRVIRTDEELMIARSVAGLLNAARNKKIG